MGFLFNGTAGADTWFGSEEADLIYGNGGVDLIYGFGGNDTLVLGSSTGEFWGGLGNDFFVVTDAATFGSIRELSNEGIDTLRTRVSMTSDLAANVENVENILYAGALTLIGNGLNNVITAGQASDTLYGRGGDDTLIGSFFNICGLFGEDGNDTMQGGDGSGAFGDNFDGGIGTDTVTYNNAPAGVVASLANPAANTGHALGDSYVSVENLTGSPFNDNLTGLNGVANVLFGGNGNDTLNGLSSLDQLVGGDGNDVFVINRAVDGATTDTIIETGGTAGGIDSVWFLAAVAGQSFSLAALGNVENLTLLGGLASNGTGNAAANVFTGNAAVNAFTGGDGNDTYILQNTTDTVTEINSTPAGGNDLVVFMGAAGQNYTLGNTFVERLSLGGTAATNGTGNQYANTLTGNVAANALNGGLGADTMTGGAGNDFFLFTTALSAANRDRITDFNVASDDVMRLAKAVFTGIGGAANRFLTAAEFNVNNANGTALDPTDRIIYDQDSGQLWYDSNGNVAGGTIVNFATVNPNQVLAAGDFYLI